MGNKCFIISFIVIFNLSFFGFIEMLDSIKPEIDSPCIMEFPMQVISGRIEHSTKKAGARYMLRYKGKYESTDEACEIVTYVTEAEYGYRTYQGENR